MKTILLPVNFFQTCDNSIAYALALTKNQEARIIFLHNYKEPCEDRNSSRSGKDGFVTSRIYSSLCSRIQAGQPEPDYDFITREGDIADAVLEVAEEKKIDYILTKAEKGKKLIRSGNNTNKIINEANCPILVIPDRNLFHDFRKITYVANYYESDISGLMKVVSLAKPLQSHIEVIHVCDGEFNDFSEEMALKEFEKIIRSRIRYNGISYRLIKGAGEEKSLLKFGNKQQTDLLVLSVYQKGLFRKIFTRNLEKKLAQKVKVPLMVMQHREKPVLMV